ncbi:hypothetical protein K3727_15770 [Rhodobacteraceae bacterium M382]|nr:hypothetical protein K3727_15770 [Rhodobacteraceae bacterium M382]
MKFIKFIFAIIILSPALLLVIFSGYYSVSIASAVIEGAKTLEPKVYVPLTVTVVSAGVGLFTTLLTQYRARKREIEAAFRERKISIYLEFLETFEHLLLAAKPELKTPEVDQNDLVVALVKVRTKAVLWGSTGVLRALNDFSKVGEGDPKKMLRVVESIQREMRKDLGLSNFGLEQDFFTKLILSDASELEKI